MRFITIDCNNMSAEELPCLKLLEQQVNEEARRASARFKQSQLAQLEASPAPSIPPQSESPKKQEEEVRLNIPVVSSTSARPNIFAQRQEQPKINIFGNSKSVNLFSLSQQTTSPAPFNIFTKAAEAPPAISTPDDELSEGSLSSNPSQQIMREPTERIMKYTYEEWKREGEWRVGKFRAGVGAVKEGVLVSLERRPQMEQVLFLVVRSEATKVVLYHAVLLPGTKVEQFMGKKENLKLTVLHKQQAQQKTKVESGSQEEKETAQGEDKQESKQEATESNQEATEGKQEVAESKQEEKQEPKPDVETVKEIREQVKLQFEREQDSASFEKLVVELLAK